MKSIRIESIKASLQESFYNSPELYPLDGGPTDEAISNLVKWVECEFDNDEQKGDETIEQWFEVAIEKYLSYFEDDFDAETEMGENEEFVREMIDHLKTKNATITRSEIMSILSQVFDIPSDVELQVEEDGTVSIYCPGFIQPEWLEGVHYMSSDATIELYELGNEYTWKYDSEN